MSPELDIAVDGVVVVLDTRLDFASLVASTIAAECGITDTRPASPPPPYVATLPPPLVLLAPAFLFTVVFVHQCACMKNHATNAIQILIQLSAPSPNFNTLALKYKPSTKTNGIQQAMATNQWNFHTQFITNPINTSVKNIQNATAIP